MTEPTTIIGAGVTVAGRLTGAEPIVVLGRVRGEVTLEAGLHLDEGGRIDARCQVHSALLRGTLVGDVTASDSIEIFPGARVQGNLSAPIVIVHPGALVRGVVDSLGGDGAPEAVVAAPATRPVGRPAAIPARAVAPPPAAPRPSTPARPAPVTPVRSASRAEVARPEPRVEPARPEAPRSEPPPPRGEPGARSEPPHREPPVSAEPARAATPADPSPEADTVALPVVESESSVVIKKKTGGGKREA